MRALLSAGNKSHVTRTKDDLVADVEHPVLVPAIAPRVVHLHRVLLALFVVGELHLERALHEEGGASTARGRR